MIRRLFKDTAIHIQYWYFNEVLRAKNQKERLSPVFKYYVPYMKSNMDYSKSPLVMGIPWLTFEAIDFLKEIIRSEMKVFEFGSGGSTRFFSERVKEIHSVEHDEKRYDLTKMKLEGYGNLHLQLIKGEETPIGQKGFVANEGEDPLNYGKYSNSILSFDDQYFDLILVDSKARNACILNSLAKLKNGVFLIVDNSNRKAYSKTLEKLNSWLVFRSFGPSVSSKRFTQTTFFKKPENGI